MIVRIVYKPNRTVAILHPAPKSKRLNETEKQWLERVFTKMMRGALEGLPYDDIDSSELPSREDRNAWEGEKGQAISINAQKQESIVHKKLIEEEGNKILEQQAIDSLKNKGELPSDYTEI